MACGTALRCGASLCCGEVHDAARNEVSVACPSRVDPTQSGSEASWRCRMSSWHVCDAFCCYLQMCKADGSVSVDQWADVAVNEFATDDCLLWRRKVFCSRASQTQLSRCSSRPSSQTFTTSSANIYIFVNDRPAVYP